MARCEPQPGQSNPVADFSGQAGKNEASLGSKVKKTPKTTSRKAAIPMLMYQFLKRTSYEWFNESKKMNPGAAEIIPRTKLIIAA